MPVAATKQNYVEVRTVFADRLQRVLGNSRTIPKTAYALSQHMKGKGYKLDPNSIKNYLNGTTVPSLVAAREIAVTLGCSLDYLAGLREDTGIW